MNAQRAAQDAGLSLAASRAHASASSRIAAVAAAAPAHRRVVVSRLAATAREAVVASHTAGAERLLAALMARGSKGEPLGDDAEAWLSKVIELGAGAPNVADAVTTGDTFAIDALLLLVR